MFYKEYLEIYKESSEEFKEFLYWCISEDERPTLARARNDVPYKELYAKLDEEQFELAQKLTRECLKRCNDIFYVQLIGFFGDTKDIPLIEEKLKVYNEKNKRKDSDFTYCIKNCKKILNALKSKND